MAGADPERVLFRSDLVEVGVFTCPPGHPRFPGGAVDGCLVAFPHTSVIIEQRGAPPVLADPNVVVFYNPRAAYARYEVDARGDRCDWIAIRPEALAGLGAEAEQPFGYTYGPTRSAVHVRERTLVRRLLAGRNGAEMPIEEVALSLVGDLDAAARQVHGTQALRRPATTRRHREVVEDARSLLYRRFREPLRLGAIANDVGASPYHLSRLFRRHTGYTVHDYLTQLRLRAAFDTLADEDVPLARLAVDLGFASHSHFTTAFRRAFGFPPRETRKISKA